MNPQRWGQIKSLFAAALDRPEAEREAFVTHATGADAGLADEVCSLLRSHAGAGDFLGTVAPALRAAALHAGDGSRAGERVGAYRLNKLIGSGGMGDVYLATRDDDQYRADVAIKLMRSDVRNPLAEQRFKTERQILAQLDHRNIARLLDGGTSATGLPYVVMELVAGDPIDRYCDAQSLNTRARVQLFLQVCAAVSYAHRHLVVHRDLKPNNILVTADGSVKLLDFGIAKLLDAHAVSTSAAAETRTLLRAMTLEYASPEQLGGGAITTVSDVYSLGVVLYRLLTGASPYRAQGDEAARVAEILSDTTPTRPSRMHSTTRTPIDTDLDHILLMALRKEPAGRYGSVEQLTDDLRNFLQGRPINARRGTLAYRGRKYLRRNKIPIAAAVLVLVSLLGGIGFALRQARSAELARAAAQRNFDSVRAISNALLSDVYAQISDLPGAAAARSNLVRMSRRYLDQLSSQADNDIELQLDLAIAYLSLGDVQGGQAGRGGGDSANATESYARAIALLRNVVAVDGHNPRADIELAKSLTAQARLLNVSQSPRLALAPAQEATELAESIDGPYRNDLDRTTTRWSAYDALANTLADLQLFEEAARTREQMVVVVEAYLAKHPDEVQGLKLLRNSYNNAALDIDSRLSAVQSAERALGLLQRSMAVTERLLANDPESPEYLATLAIQRMNLGDTLYYAGRFAESIAMYRLAVPGLRKAADDKADGRAQMQLAVTQTGLAGALLKVNDPAAATAQLDSAEPVLRQLLARDPKNITTRFTLAFVEMSRGEVLARRARQPARPRAARIEDLRHARERLETGVNRMKKVNEVYVLAGGEKGVLDDGLAALAAADIALAQLGGRP